ncbi:hypothetical protein DL93DRAFT_2095689 [Clavulina sp. PMI_390]|nr:hypothetical protein DL93DRAFT_2095689 [Clavulina sp. PMI_390]
MPSLAEISEQDKKASLYQHAMIDRLRQSQYHMVEESKRPVKKKSKRLDLDALEEEEKQAGEDEDEEELEEHEEDAYEEDEEDDYNDNFFETGSQDDPNDMVGGGDDGGGGDGRPKTYCITLCLIWLTPSTTDD